MNKQLQLRLEKLQNFGNKAAVGLGLGVAAASSFAAIDTAAIEAQITSVATAAGVIGAAVLVMHYGIKAYKWIKSAG